MSLHPSCQNISLLSGPVLSGIWYLNTFPNRHPPDTWNPGDLGGGGHWERSWTRCFLWARCSSRKGVGWVVFSWQMMEAGFAWIWLGVYQETLGFCMGYQLYCGLFRVFSHLGTISQITTLSDEVPLVIK